jgi:hypothetical protein
MTIQRRFEPDSEVLDQVAEILYELLAEAPHGRAESSETHGAVGQGTTCHSMEPEQ